ncbi:MAG: YIP1 family protein [Clostridiales bacterium]|nr:YIP1 family protein [Clostridiales bacterium]
MTFVSWAARSVRTLFACPLHTMFHPADGYYDMRHEGGGSLKQAAVLFVLFWLSFSFNRQYAGFVVNEIYPLSLSLLGDLFSIALVFLLLCAANWSVTTLMDGEGAFRHIAIALSYALLPLIFALAPATVFSRFLTLDEAAFYYMIIGAALAWSAMLLFMGILTIHNYTVGKTVATLVLTAVAALIIVFLALLVGSLIQQMWTFVGSVYSELLYR